MYVYIHVYVIQRNVYIQMPVDVARAHTISLCVQHFPLDISSCPIDEVGGGNSLQILAKLQLCRFEVCFLTWGCGMKRWAVLAPIT